MKKTWRLNTLSYFNAQNVNFFMTKILKVEKLDENRKIFSRIGFNYLALALIPILFQILLVNIIALWDVTLIRNTNIQTVLSSLTNYILILPIFMYLMGKIESTPINKKNLSSTPNIYKTIIMSLVTWIVKSRSNYYSVMF